MGERAAADDLVQDTLAHAFAELERDHAPSDLRAWAFATMHEIYVGGMRALHEDEPVDEDCAEPAPEPLLAGTLLPGDLERALAQLGAEQRSVLLLVVLEGMSYEEVASVLDISVGTVIARLSRAQRKLRAVILAERRLKVVK